MLRRMQAHALVAQPAMVAGLLVAKIPGVHYRFKKVFMQKVMTHREYDDWNKRYRKGKI